MDKIVLEPKHTYALGGGWSRKATVNGVTYFVGVERGKAVRIAFKPRGQNRGFKWWGFVRTLEGKGVWEDEVSKSFGARGLLLYAGLLPDHRCKPGRGECAYCARRSVRERNS